MHRWIIVCLSLAVSSFAAAQQDPVEQRLREAINARAPELQIDAISPTPVSGLYQVISGAQIMYLSADGRYLLDGSLIDIEQRENLTETALSVIRRNLLADYDEANMLIYAADGGKAKYSLTVFTDTTCPFCSRFHEELQQLTRHGVRVRYLLYPRAGLDSPAYQQLQSVWCADNPQQAMTHVKAGKPIESSDCSNPIAEHIQIARQLGLQGTPMIVLDNGMVVHGYRPASELIAMLERGSGNHNSAVK